MTTRNHTPEQPADDERQQFARYRRELAQVREEDEAKLVSAVLNDEDKTMAQVVVVGHHERRATELLTEPRFPGWANSMTQVIAEREFLTRRLREWTRLRAIATDDAWTPEDVAPPNPEDTRRTASRQRRCSSQASHAILDQVSGDGVAHLDGPLAS